ncbi:hypothetical protein FACS189418_9300 [Clostridia bacterium]|nr:hypothetical protein FACS189418_9300 [Clostridia bacterium]
MKNQEVLQSLSEQIEEEQKSEWISERKQEKLSALYSRKELIDQKIQEEESIREEVRAINLAISTIESLSVSVRTPFGTYLNQAASRNVAELTHGAYADLYLDDNMKVSLDSKVQIILAEQAGKGTLSQASLALRLALIQFLWPGQEMPLILDESFVFYDEERLISSLSFLAKQYKGQILLFTCHKREAAILKRMGVNYQLITL